MFWGNQNLLLWSDHFQMWHNFFMVKYDIIAPVHRGRKCPFNTLKKKRFWNKVFDILKLIRKFKIYIWMTISGSKSVKKSQKMLKKVTIWSYTWFFWNFFALANLIHINSYNMRKKMWCHYISLGVIFSHSLKLKHHFRIYYQQLSTTSENEKWIFLANKSLDTVH